MVDVGVGRVGAYGDLYVVGNMGRNQYTASSVRIALRLFN